MLSYFSLRKFADIAHDIMAYKIKFGGKNRFHKLRCLTQVNTSNGRKKKEKFSYLYTSSFPV